MHEAVRFRPRAGQTLARSATVAEAARLSGVLYLLAALWLPGALSGAGLTRISDAEAFKPPTAARLAAVFASAQLEGWAAQTPPLRGVAIEAYEHEQFAAADAWFHLGRWAALFSEPTGQFRTRWAGALINARVSIPPMPILPAWRSRNLGDSITPEMQEWLVSHPDFSAEFFTVLSPLDYLPNVLRILDEIHRSDPGRFSTYASLALALAVVYDVPPPLSWPHQQVSPSALPRKFPPATEAFAWWTRQDELGRTYQKLAQLSADELKFVVDAAAPFSELEWSQQISDYPLSHLARTYTMIRYRQDRMSRNAMMWPDPTYRLVDILAAGGICVDQAYFATETGKARGVPTLLFHGEGGNGRHAWFGYLDGRKRWQLDAGRVAMQRLVNGFAYDPQTWSLMSEHELLFLSERFRQGSAFRESRVHTEFAHAFFSAGNMPDAMEAARRALKAERRNQAAWATLIAASQSAGRSVVEVEAVMREAEKAFERYPDLEARYANRLCASLRARGEMAAADAEELRIARKNRGSRTDINVRQAQADLLRAVGSQPLAEQIRVYNAAVDTLGPAGGIGFFDQIVVGFAEHLADLHQPAEAVRAVQRAHQTLKVAPGSQLDEEFIRLMKELIAAK